MFSKLSHHWEMSQNFLCVVIIYDFYKQEMEIRLKFPGGFY